MDRQFQVAQLHRAGAKNGDIEGLLRYTENHFSEGPLEAVSLPLEDEAFVACWQEWADEAKSRDAFEVLAAHLPQLRFPIREGIGQSEDYRAATLRGVSPDELSGASGFSIPTAGALELHLYPSFAGRIPLLITRRRDLFVALFRALARKNEPVPVSDAQGASMVAGLNNWSRIHTLRRQWNEQSPAERESATWAEEFARIRSRKELYQDRFILLSDGPYSSVPAAALGLDESRWRELSLIIRREHECTHYFTRRVFGSARNHLYDELLADYVGLVRATGCFRADWFLFFLGLESYPDYRAGARLDLYRGDPPLSDPAFRVLHTLIRSTALNLERFDRAFWTAGDRSDEDIARMVLALATLDLETLASDTAGDRLRSALEDG